MTSILLFLVGTNYLADGMQGYLQGPIRALHLQKKASYVSIVCMWLLGLPLAATFAFACDFGVRGLLMGFLAATALQATSYLVIVYRADWDEIASFA